MITYNPSGSLFDYVFLGLIIADYLFILFGIYKTLTSSLKFNQKTIYVCAFFGILILNSTNFLPIADFALSKEWFNLQLLNLFITLAFGIYIISTTKKFIVYLIPQIVLMILASAIYFLASHGAGVGLYM